MQVQLASFTSLSSYKFLALFRLRRVAWVVSQGLCRCGQFFWFQFANCALKSVAEWLTPVTQENVPCTRIQSKEKNCRIVQKLYSSLDSRSYRKKTAVQVDPKPPHPIGHISTVVRFAQWHLNIWAASLRANATYSKKLKQCFWSFIRIIGCLSNWDMVHQRTFVQYVTIFSEKRFRIISGHYLVA